MPRPSDSQTTDIRGLVSDPRFRALPADRRRAVLARAGADPRFIERLLGAAAPSSRGGPSISAARERGLVDAARDWLAGVASDRRIAQQDRQEAREAGIGLTPTTGEMVGAAGTVAAVPAVASNPLLAALALASGLAGSKLGGELGYAAGEQVAPGVGSLGEEVGSAVGGLAGGAAPYGARAAIRVLPRAARGQGVRPAQPAAPAQPPAGKPGLSPKAIAIARELGIDLVASMLPGGALVRGAGGALLRQAGRGVRAAPVAGGGSGSTVAGSGGGSVAGSTVAGAAAPVAAATAAESASVPGGATRALLDFAARSGAKPGSKVWIALDASGAPVRVLTPGQAAAATRAGEAVTWVRNVGDPIAAATRRKAAESALQGLGVVSPTP